MKKVLTAISITLGVVLAFNSTVFARGGHGHGHGDSFSLSFGFGDYGYPGYYPGWCSRPVYYASPVYYAPAPAVVYTQPPVVVTQPSGTSVVTATATTGAPPYGYLISQGIAKSPWSDFSVSTGGKVSGQVVYDANNGKPFRIP